MTGAWNCLFQRHQFMIPFDNLLINMPLKFQGWKGGAGKRFIVFINHMKNNILIIGICMMFMLMPIGSTHMKLNIAGPESSTHPQAGFEKIGACVMIMYTGINDYDRLSFRRH